MIDTKIQRQTDTLKWIQWQANSAKFSSVKFKKRKKKKHRKTAKQTNPALKREMLVTNGQLRWQTDRFSDKQSERRSEQLFKHQEILQTISLWVCIRNVKFVDAKHNYNPTHSLHHKSVRFSVFVKAICADLLQQWFVWGVFTFFLWGKYSRSFDFYWEDINF